GDERVPPERATEPRDSSCKDRVGIELAAERMQIESRLIERELDHRVVASDPGGRVAERFRALDESLRALLEGVPFRLARRMASTAIARAGFAARRRDLYLHASVLARQ